MRHCQVPETVRSRGYELLFLLAEASALAIHPTARNADKLLQELSRFGEARNLRALVDRGLVEAGGPATNDVLRLTELGHMVFEGGRNPEQAWKRPWDGQWRLLTFDLPRSEGEARTRFWRWLKANHFGRLQGSVWITPDPVPAIEATASEAGFDPSAVLIFTGQAAGNLSPQEIAATAWDFSSIDNHYRRYETFARNALATVSRKSLPPERFPGILDEDRRLWWKSLRRDPLLPESLLPDHYQAVQAWELRRKLHKALFRSLGLSLKD